MTILTTTTPWVCLGLVHLVIHLGRRTVEVFEVEPELQRRTKIGHVYQQLDALTQLRKLVLHYNAIIVPSEVELGHGSADDLSVAEADDAMSEPSEDGLGFDVQRCVFEVGLDFTFAGIEPCWSHLEELDISYVTGNEFGDTER